MNSYVAFLRGIGPGNPNMRNDKLRGVFETLGLQNVRSVISSGNILFETDATDIAELESHIEQALLNGLGIKSTTIIRSQKQLQNLVDSSPFKGAEHSRQTYLTVTFLKYVPKNRLQTPPQPQGKLFKVVGVDAQVNAIFGITDTTAAKTPDFMSWLEAQFGKDITTRTWATVLRISKRPAEI